MRVTLLGHASVFVELKGARCLMDLVFQDPFEDTAVVSCPKRAIDPDAIPPIDLLVLSHAHLDHFDIPSLACVAKRSKRCEVLCPEERAITYALGRLGFENVHAEPARRHFQFGSYELLTTPSFVSNVVEFGVVFKDRSGSFWNQVDTIITPAAAPDTVKQAGAIDLLFAMYASQNFDFFQSRGTGFPHAMHQMNLATVKAIAPRLVVPGSAGFRFAGYGMEWCNAFLFPMSRERFIADLARVAPALRTALADPGDVFEIDGGAIERRSQTCRFARMLEEDTKLLRFDPTATIPPLMDPNPTGATVATLEEGVEACLQGFLRFVQTSYADDDEVARVYRESGATYAVGVVYPDGKERWYRVVFDRIAPQFVWSETEVAASDAGHRIVASALVAWNRRTKSYFYLRAFSRKWSTLCRVSLVEGAPNVAPIEVQDLLAYYLERRAKGAELAVKQWLDFQLEPFVGRVAS